MDYVGGVRLKGDDLSKAINKRCIVEFLDGQITVRHLQKANTPFFYKVCALNKNVDEKLASEESFLEVASAAPILWHRTFP